MRGGSHGIRLRDSSFVTIRDCEIHDTEDVALSANYSGSSYEGIHIVGNNIHDTGGTGEGLYLGCNSNACQFFDSVIEFNWIHDTDASDVVQGDGIEIKEGSYNNVIRHNVIHDTNYPCILTYGTVGNGSRNVIEGNLMWGCGDHAIQSAADAIIQNNIILGAVQDGIRSQPHQDAEPGNLTIVHNTILQATRDAIRVDGAAGRVTIANNAVYAETGNALRVSGDLDGVVVSGNVGAGALQGVTGGVDTSGDVAVDLISANYSGDVPADVFPAENSKLIGAADATHVVSTDFNGTDRAGNLGAGAYRFDSTGNPGWALQAGIKEVSSNGGSGGSGGSGQGGAAGNGDAGDGHESGTGANDGANANNNSGGSSSAGDADQQGGSAAANDGGDDGGCTVAAISRSAGPTWPWLALGILVFCALVARRHQVPTAVRRCH